MMVNVEMQNSKVVGWERDRIEVKMKQTATRKGDHNFGLPRGTIEHN